LIDRIAGVFVLALIVVACLPWTFSLIHDSIARAVLLVIGFGAIAGALIFVLIGVRFRQWLDRWMLTRHLSAASRICAALSPVPPLRHDCLGVLGRDPFTRCHRSVVLRQSGRRTGQFRASSVPHAAGDF
jgi:hypothetical protein